MMIPFEQSSGILHLGANDGQEAEAYHAKGVERVIWVEALPDIYAKLKKNVSRYPNHTALRGCLSDKDGQKVSFGIASNGGQSSSFLEFGTHAKEHPDVKMVGKVELETIRLDTLLARNDIRLHGKDWLLVVDLQGAELLALKGMGAMLRKFKYAYVEVNEKELYIGCPLVNETDDYLAGFGFVGMESEMTPQGWGNKHYAKPCQSHADRV